VASANRKPTFSNLKNCEEELNIKDCRRREASAAYLRRSSTIAL
jgi:hypothetical protein